MHQYRHLVGAILSRGTRRHQRATLSDGTRPMMRALFGWQMRFDLDVGFPLVTVKRTPFRLIAEELLWILSGSTNVRPLQAKGAHIWDEWADAETGELGPIYGKQWRRWERSDGTTVDQVARLVENLYQRSADVFLGLPFNIASYALFTHMLAHVTRLGVGELVVSIGNAHIYENHVPQACEIIGRNRPPFPPPTLAITREHASIDDFTIESFRLDGYQSHPALAGDVAV